VPLALNEGESTSAEELKSLLIEALKEDRRFAEELAEILFNRMVDRIAEYDIRAIRRGELTEDPRTSLEENG